MLLRAVMSGLCALTMLILSAGQARGVVLDWDVVGAAGWAQGSLNNTYQADPSDPDSVLTVDVASNGGAPIVQYSGLPNPMTPLVQAAFQGGLGSTENSLTIAVNLANLSQSITVSISFAASGGAGNVSFKLFDIDAGGGAQDQLTEIRGLSMDGTTWIAPTITTSLDNQLIGSGLSQVVNGTASTASVGAQSGRGNVTIDFGPTQISMLSFTFGSASFADPAYQHFALHDISFTPVPEINPALMSAASCFAAAAVGLRHSRRRRRQ
jgi:hypothetical protein